MDYKFIWVHVYLYMAICVFIVKIAMPYFFLLISFRIHLCKAEIYFFF